jgi:hypothetical protein
MTPVPWELNWSPGFRAIQIPSDDLPTIVDVARRYRANYLLLLAPRLALDALYRANGPTLASRSWAPCPRRRGATRRSRSSASSRRR